MQKKLWLLLFSAICWSCSDEGVKPDPGHDYFPIIIGDYRIYDVQETTYVDAVATSEEYQLRESFFDSLVNGDEVTYLMRIERRENENNDWTSVSSVSVRRTDHFLEYREHNESLVKLSFPVKLGRTWDGNALNQEVEMIYEYQPPDDESSFGDLDPVKVLISDLPANIVEQDERHEIYGKGVGLLVRDFIEIEFCTIGCSSENEPENGRILLQTLNTYGSFEE